MIHPNAYMIIKTKIASGSENLKSVISGPMPTFAKITAGAKKITPSFALFLRGAYFIASKPPASLVLYLKNNKYTVRERIIIAAVYSRKKPKNEIHVFARGPALICSRKKAPAK